MNLRVCAPPHGVSLRSTYYTSFAKLFHLTNDNSTAQVASGRNSTDDLYSAGKSMFVAMIAVVTAEIGLIARFWTWEFCLCAFFSYALVSGLPGPRSRDLVESRPSPELL